MVIGGPNTRTDYHVNAGEEFFYQLEGDIVLKTIEDGVFRDVTIKEGEILLLPPNVPHSPRRPVGTVGLVIERQRKEHEIDALQWHCESCNHLLHEARFSLQDITKDLIPAIQHFYASTDLHPANVAYPSRAVMKIDLHTHILPEIGPICISVMATARIRPSITSRVARMMRGEVLPRDRGRLLGCAATSTDCDHHHVDVQVLSTVLVMFPTGRAWRTPSICLDANDHLMSAATIPTLHGLDLTDASRTWRCASRAAA